VLGKGSSGLQNSMISMDEPYQAIPQVLPKLLSQV
jgi:hypothetical protein